MGEDRELPYGRQWVDEEDVEAVARVLRGDWLTTGPLVAEFEAELARAAGAPFAVVSSSGTAALHSAYVAAGLGPGDELLTSPLTFVATASCARHLGATVRFADVDPDTGNLDPEAAAAAIGPRTRLLVPVDYAGHPADYEAIAPLAKSHDLALVADAAHSFGATYRGEPVGSLADATTTSFHPVKLVTSAEGGALFTAREDWAERARAFRNHGIEAGEAGSPPWHYEIRELGLNYRLPDVLCALGLSQLGKREAFLSRRRELAGRYVEALGDVDALELPVVREGVQPAWHLFVLRVREASRRRAFFEGLRARGLRVQLHYIPVHLHAAFRELGQGAGSCPVAEDYAARALSIPLYPRMTEDDFARSVEAIRCAARELL